MKYASKLFVTITALLLLGAKHSVAQEQERKDSIKIEFNEDAPMLSARETPKRYYIRKVNVSGIKNLNENLVRATSGLIPGDSIYLPSSFVGNSITRLWGQRYFSDVKVGATIDGDSVDLELMLKERPRVYNWNIVGEGIGSSKRNDLLEKLNHLMANDEAAVAEYLANPVGMDKEVFWSIENYGSSMAPFYTVLAQWVGALLTAVLIKVRVKKRDDLADLRLHEWYFGRLGLYLLVGIAQALVVSAGDLLYVRIQCLSPLRFVLLACINSIVFMMINYALVFALDNIGLGAGVIILVLQVAGSGGTYPVEVLPGIFKILYPFMPFRYAMDAMRECIAGTYGHTYAKCMCTLLLFFVGAVVFGLVMYKPAQWLNRLITESKEKSEIML